MVQLWRVGEGEEILLASCFGLWEKRRREENHGAKKRETKTQAKPKACCQKPMNRRKKRGVAHQATVEHTHTSTDVFQHNKIKREKNVHHHVFFVTATQSILT